MQKAQRRIKRRLTALLAVASLAALLLVAAPASAATTSAAQGYTTSARVEQTTDPHHSNLPFTGLDLFAIVGVGAALLAVGVGVRKLSTTTT